MKLFRNSGEAIVFWLALSGLLIVTVLSIFRYQAFKSVLEQYREVSSGDVEMVDKLEAAQVSIDSLIIQQSKLLKRISQLEQRPSPPTTEEVEEEQAAPQRTQPVPDSPEETIIILPDPIDEPPAF